VDIQETRDLTPEILTDRKTDFSAGTGPHHDHCLVPHHKPMMPRQRGIAEMMPRDEPQSVREGPAALGRLQEPIDAVTEGGRCQLSRREQRAAQSRSGGASV